MTKRYILILSSLLTFFSVLGASVKLSVSPQRGKSNIAVGDVFYVTINVTDINEQPSMPTVPGAKLMYFDEMSGSQSVSEIVNGKAKNFNAKYFVYTATLRAEKEGTYTLGPLSVGGVRSNQVTYSIGSQSSSSQTSSAVQNSSVNYDNIDDDTKPKFIGKGDSNLFLRATVSESTAYEQQALVYTVKLYSSYDAIKFIGATAAPKFDGFVVEESKDISTSLTLENYQGKTYQTAVIARYIIFPQMSGNLKVTGNTYTISVDRREYYHDSFWGNLSYSTPLQLNVTPNDLVINVKSLPEHKPANYSGGVGKFTITSQLKNSDFKTNQAASIIYTVQGTGNLKYVQLPDLSGLYPPEIEVYTPKTTQDINVGASNVSGTVTFDYSFMPLEEGEFRIPDVKLVYFNPSTGNYETSIARGYTINVGKGAPSSTNNRKRFDNKLQTVNVKDLKKEPKPVILKFPYWLWFIIPTLLLVVSLSAYRRYISQHADMIALNSKRADKIARKRLRKAALAMKQGNSERFYDELLIALWGYLGDKLKIPTSELMRDNVRQVMSSKNIPETMIEMFIGVIDDAEFAKYSSAGTTENLYKIYEEAVNTINNLEKEFKK